MHWQADLFDGADSVWQLAIPSKANLILAKVFSVKLINKDNLKKEKKDCKSKIPINASAIFLALTKSLAVTQSTSIPNNFGKANAVAPVNRRKTKPK